MAASCRATAFEVVQLAWTPELSDRVERRREGRGARRPRRPRRRVPAWRGQRRPVLNIPRAISRAAVRMKSLNARRTSTTSCTRPPPPSARGARGGWSAARAAWARAALRLPASSASPCGAGLELGGQLLAGRLAVDGLGVLRVARAGLHRRLHRRRVGRPHQRLGARSRVQATGVGAPRSFITVTTASPMPRLVITSPRSSYAEFG